MTMARTTLTTAATSDRGEDHGRDRLVVHRLGVVGRCAGLDHQRRGRPRPRRRSRRWPGSAARRPPRRAPPARSGSRSRDRSRRRDPVADAADRGHVARTLGIVAELVAQPPDVDVDGPVEDLGLVLAVDGIEQLVAAQDAAAGLDEAGQEPELDPGQGDRHAVAGDLVAVEVDDQVGQRQARAGAGVGVRAGGAAQDRLDAQDQLGRRERLGQVVVGAVLEAGDAVDGRAAGRDDQDRRGGRLVVAADRPDDGPAVQLGEHQVEDDQRRPVALDGVEGGRAVGGGHDREAVALEVGAHQPDDLGVVVDDEDRSLGDRRGGLGSASGAW